MRIIQPKRNRKSGSKASSRLSSKQEPDSVSESGSFTNVENEAELTKASKPQMETSLEQFQRTEPSQFSDGRKRRRSEFSDLSFFNDSSFSESNQPDTNQTKIAEPNEDGAGVLSADQPAQLLVPVDDNKKEFNRLLASGMRLLAMREHSAKEVVDKLLAKTESADIAYSVVDELVKNKYLSDERFTESFVRSRSNKGYGPVKIRSELKNKGVSSQLIADYLDMNSALWFDSARELHTKKYGNVPLDDYKGWTKRARYMQSRGFTMEHIQVTLPELKCD